MSGSGLDLALDLTLVTPAERGVLEQLMQLYLHDFSQFAEIGSPHGELGEDGRFTYPHLASYWAEADRKPLILRVAGRLAGFALVNRRFVTGLTGDHAMAEFFIARKYRRAGIGSAAARRIFGHFPGRWEVAVAQYNPEALLFWRKAVASADRIGDVTEHVGDGKLWTGTILRFMSRAATQ
ncbi:Predicted acetyltransferase [Rhizobiales bacterium GAS113]|nr:Predicted acetyltransferase [Rhizobiales bacterium GAS113]